MDSEHESAKDLLYGVYTLLLCLCVAWYFQRRLAVQLRPVPNPSVHVVCLANEKGGVGKSTVVFHTARWYAQQNPDKRVLVLDASTFGDITSACAGPKADLQKTFGCTGTIEHLATASKRWFGEFSINDQLIHVQTTLSPASPSNLYLLSNDKGYSAWHAHRTQTRVGRSETTMRTALQLAHVAAYLRNGLAGTGEDWLVLCDTDGGEQHALTRFALMAADAIVLPCRTDTASIVRLTDLLATAESLVTRGLSNAILKAVFFNAITVGKNVPDTENSICRTFTPKSKATLESMNIIRDHLVQISPNYPSIMQPLRSLINENATHKFFTAVRHGGASFGRTETAVCDRFGASAKLAPDVATDLKALADLILP